MVTARRGQPKAERWLLVVVSTAGAPSALRVHAWRTLRALGAVYLQSSVAVLPERPETVRVVRRLVDRVMSQGGEARGWPITLRDAGQEAQLVASFQAERSDEYAEVCGRTRGFFDEIAEERAKGRVTYTEVDESEADLARLRSWLRRIEARDYFDAPGHAEAIGAVDACLEVLAAFEAEALQAEMPDDVEDRARPLRLRAVRAGRDR